jgi:AcrR family transcriptional regulator
MSARTRAKATRLALKTMAKFLSAAEEIFGKHGYEGTTIRAISKRARVNLGTLQHYWGTKRELFSYLFEERFRQLRNVHLSRLRAIEARAAAEGSAPKVEEVLRALIEPSFYVASAQDPEGERGGESAAERKRFYALYGRALMDPAHDVVTELNRIFEESIRLFLDLMRRACPQLTPAELDWRVNCILGAQVFSLVYAERVGRFYGTEADVDEGLASKWIVHLLMNGLGAPAFAEEREPVAVSTPRIPVRKRAAKAPRRNSSSA